MKPKLRGRPFDAILPQSSLQNHNFPRKVAHSERIRAFLRMNILDKEDRVIDHDEVLGLRVLFDFENLLSFDAKQLDRHPVRIPMVVVLTPAIRKANQRLKGLRLA